MSDEIIPIIKPQIAAIIPVYNEALNLGSILNLLKKTKILDEIILVDDGSIDGSGEILKMASQEDKRIQVIQHEKNMGKGQAIFSGWTATSAAILLLLDADLKALTVGNIEDLLNPVIKRKTDMTLGLFRGGHFSTDLSHRVTPFLSGQRGLRSEVLKYVSVDAAKGYGFEIALTVAVRRNRFRTKTIPLKGVWHPSSELRTERGFFSGLLWRLRMYHQIIRAWFISSRERLPKRRTVFLNNSK
jgi:glycosyltransferase involved in cell wall biosynthesis